jgi:hypothetical protein
MSYKISSTSALMFQPSTIVLLHHSSQLMALEQFQVVSRVVNHLASSWSEHKSLKEGGGAQ